jgi:hypothetical protein
MTDGIDRAGGSALTEAQLVLPDVRLRSPSAGGISSGLPLDLVERAVQRLGLFALAVSATATIECVSSHGTTISITRTIRRAPIAWI